MKRTYWNSPVLGTDSENWPEDVKIAQVKTEQDANLVSSRLDDGLHAPALDIDLPCELVPSSTPGHFHLYIDKALTWEQYRLLLAVLADLGIVERGWYLASVREEQSFLRPPGQRKLDAA